jgi:hypothetical protein
MFTEGQACIFSRDMLPNISMIYCNYFLFYSLGSGSVTENAHTHTHTTFVDVMS